MQMATAGDAARARGTRRRLVRLGAALAAVFVLAHLPYLPLALEDVDAVNFALGLREFDPAKHQPHPPGYPVYIAMGRLSAAVLRAAGADATDARIETRALAIWSVLGGAVAALALSGLFGALGDASPSRDHVTGVAVCGAALALVSPLMWVGGVRPMSDVPGLAVTVIAQALVARLLMGVAGHRSLVAGAIVAGLAIGIRTQALWLTAPLVAWATVECVMRRDWRTVVTTVGAGAASCLAWVVPLVVASGGWTRYRAAVRGQADDDFASADMLWKQPTLRRLAGELYDSFVLPWDHPLLAGVVLGLAAGGCVILLLRARRAALVLAAGFVPYAAFHLLFQESVHVRYALPLVVPVSYAAVVAFQRMSRRLVVPGTIVLAAACVAVAAPVVAAYAAAPAPEWLAVSDMERAEQASAPGLVVVHHSVARALQPTGRLRPWMQRPPYQREWAAILDYWQTGGTAPVWLLADQQRVDLPRLQLPLVDHAAWRDAVVYRWPLSQSATLGGTRPSDVAWYRIARPRWWLDAGWALTPELAGLARRAGRDPATGLTGRIRRENVPVVAAIGGRHLGRPGDPPVVFDLAIDGHVIEQWRVTPDERAFLKVFSWPRVPAGAGDYAELRVTAHAPDDAPAVIESAVEQFDLQPARDLVVGYGRGWYELEVEARGVRRRPWRWTSASSDLVVHNGTGGDLLLRIEGDAPHGWLEAPPVALVRAGRNVIARAVLAPHFTWDVPIDADALASAGGLVTIETSRTFSPAESGRTGDARRLGLRIFACSLTPR